MLLRKEALKKWERAGISDDFIFGKVMRNYPDLCLPKRSRYYQSMTDLMLLDRGIFSEETDLSTALQIFARKI